MMCRHTNEKLYFELLTSQHPQYYLHLSYRTIPVTLTLKDPQHPDQDLGTLELVVNLAPKDSPIEERRDSMVHTESFFT